MIREYYQLYANKKDNPGEMEKFLETHKLCKMTHEEIENLKRPLTCKEKTNQKYAKNKK